VAREQVYGPGTKDYDEETFDHKFYATVYQGPRVTEIGACFRSEVKRISRNHVSYNPLGPNSNTVASTLLMNCGVPRENPVGDWNTPGWNWGTL
jgi:hypothetical protein